MIPSKERFLNAFFQQQSKGSEERGPQKPRVMDGNAGWCRRSPRIPRPPILLAPGLPTVDRSPPWRAGFEGMWAHTTDNTLNRPVTLSAARDAQSGLETARQDRPPSAVSR